MQRMKCLTLPLTKEKRKKRGAKTLSNFKNISKTLETFSLVTLVTNYHKQSLLPLVVRP